MIQNSSASPTWNAVGVRRLREDQRGGPRSYNYSGFAMKHSRKTSNAKSAPNLRLGSNGVGS